MLQSKPAELWALLELDRHAEFEKRKLRLEKISELDVKSVNATDSTIFTPVVLNSFLQLGDDPIARLVCDTPLYDRVRYFTPEPVELCNRLTFDFGSSLLDTYISDPPCMRAEVALTYYSDPERYDLFRLEACFVVQTGKPMTLRNVFAETWTDAKWADQMTSAKIYDGSGRSNEDDDWNFEPAHEYHERDKFPELATLADIITSLEIKYGCKLVFEPKSTIIELESNPETNFAAFPLVPTEFEWRDVVAHDKDAYAALMLAVEADEKRWEGA